MSTEKKISVSPKVRKYETLTDFAETWIYRLHFGKKMITKYVLGGSEALPRVASFVLCVILVAKDEPATGGKGDFHSKHTVLQTCFLIFSFSVAKDEPCHWWQGKFSPKTHYYDHEFLRY